MGYHRALSVDRRTELRVVPAPEMWITTAQFLRPTLACPYQPLGRRYAAEETKIPINITMFANFLYSAVYGAKHTRNSTPVGGRTFKYRNAANPPMPPDALPVWVATGVAAAAFLGVALAFPASPPPAAAAAADTVDRVAAADYPSTATHALTAETARVGPRRIALRGDGGTAAATFAYGPVVPVPDSGRLARVLRGTPPGEEFADAAAFRRIANRARNRTPRWAPVDSLRVRRVSWREVDVTLVGA